MKMLRLSWLVFVGAWLAAMSLLPGIPGARAMQARATGSVTARVFVCPDDLSLATVQAASDPSAELATCTPSSGEVIAPRLRAVSGGEPQPGALFAEGVYLWTGLPYGSYAFSGSDAPSRFEGWLIADGRNVPVPDQERGEVAITRAVPDIERRFFYFAPPAVPESAVSLTLYRCPDAERLTPLDCSLLVDPPRDFASFLPDLWSAPLLGTFRDGSTVWHGLPFGIYSIVFSGLLEPGEGAAIPELACISPDRCPMLIGPAAPSANLELYVFPLPANAPDSDGDGFADVHERAGFTDPDDPASPGPDRVHSDVDTDADSLSDQDERFFQTDAANPDTDGDGLSDGEEVAAGTDPTA